MGIWSMAADQLSTQELWTPYPKQALAEEYASEVDELLFGGAAGPGKTEWGMEHVIGEMRAYPGNLGLIVRRVFPSLTDVLRRLQDKLHGEAVYNKNEHSFTFDNGSVIFCGQLQYADTVRNYQGWEIGVVFFEELTEFLEEQWTYLVGRLRVPSTVQGPPYPRPHAIATANPGGPGHEWVKGRWVKPEPIATESGRVPEPCEVWRPRRDPELPDIEPGTRVFIPATHEDNPALLEKTPDYLAKLGQISDRGLRLAMLHGDWDAVEETPGALWKAAWLDGGRVGKVPVLRQRTVIAVDPSEGDEKGDAFGVAVCTLAQDGVGYVEDVQGWRGRTTQEMVDGVLDLYDYHRASAIVWEKNHGGKWAPALVWKTRPSANIRIISASEGKLTRAEPIAALFQPLRDRDPLHAYRARLVGYFPDFERQATRYTGKPGEASPDELDAVVWGLTELLIGTREAGAHRGRDSRGRGRR